MIRRLLLFISLLSTSVFAQEDCTFTLSGYVIDEHDGQPLSFASISVKGEPKGAISDSLGFYQLDELCAGIYTIRCSHVGCEPIFKELEVAGNTVLNFYPEHHTEVLAELVVIGERPIDEIPQAKSVLPPEEIQLGKGSSLAQNLKSLSGVTMLQTGNNVSKPVIHGLHSNRILILNNGVRHESQQWGNEHAPEIDPFLAEEMAVIKGASGVRFGPDAIAGVVIVSPGELSQIKGTQGVVDLVGFSNGRVGVASAKLEGTFHKLPGFTYRVQGTAKKGGNISSPRYYLDNTGIEELNFSWAAGWNKTNFGIEAFYSQFNTDIGIFSGAHIGNLTDLQRAIESESPLQESEFTYDIDRPFQHIEHELIKTNAFVRTGTLGKLKAQYARQYNLRYEYDKDPPLNDSLAALNRPELQFEITTHTADLNWEHYRRKGWKGSVGISALFQANTYTGRLFIPNFKKQGYGAYLLENWQPGGGRLHLEFGVRYDYVYQQVFRRVDDEILEPDFDFSNWSMNVGAIYDLSESLKLRANMATAWRPPQVSELFSDGLHHGAAAIEIGDENLDKERVYNAQINLEFQRERLRINADLYSSWFSNFIYLNPLNDPVLTIRGAFPSFAYEQAEVLMHGADVSAQYNFNDRLSWDVRASLIRAFNRDVDDYLIQMPADRIVNGLRFEKNDFLGMKNFSSRLGLEFVAKQWRVPKGVDYARPPEAYALLHFSFGGTLELGKQKILLSLSIQNLTNTTYRDYMNRFRYFSDEPGTNVSVKISVPFEIKNNKHENR